MNSLSTFQNFIYFQVDTNLLFLYTHAPLHYINARLGTREKKVDLVRAGQIKFLDLIRS